MAVELNLLAKAPENAEDLEVLDLFCGAGGLSLGAHSAGFRVAGSIDVDTDLTSCYLANFPHARLSNMDLGSASPRQVWEFIGEKEIAGVVGGPPCQGFSEIGRRSSEDPRNGLVRSFMSVVAEIQPAFFLMENVPPLAEKSNRHVLDEALDLLPSSYATLSPLVLDSAMFGAATHRRRMVVIGFNRTKMDPLPCDAFVAPAALTPTTVRSAIGDLPEPTNFSDDDPMKYRKVKESAYAVSLRAAPPDGIGSEASRQRWSSGTVKGVVGTRHSDLVARRFEALSPGERDMISRYPRLSWDRPAPVLRAGTGRDRGSFQAARPVHPGRPRVITVREAARIQGFPDWFEFPSTKWHSHRMIGNSVSPIFAAALLSTLNSALES